MVHINKGRIHAFRKLSTSDLPADDCHATLRAELLEREKIKKDELCISVAWDWMYRGVTEAGIRRELAATLNCAALNRNRAIKSLGIAEVALLHMSRSIRDQRRRTEGRHYQPTTEVICRGILPALRVLVKEHQTAMEDARVQVETGTTGHRRNGRNVLEILSMTDAGQNPAVAQISAYGRDYNCKVCSRELSNVYSHCSGCETLMQKDFNLCMECYSKKKFKENVAMKGTVGGNLHSAHHHTGGFWNIKCVCAESPLKGNCNECAQCARCCCACHSKFSVHCRFFSEEDEERLLRRVEETGKKQGNYLERYLAGTDKRKCALWPCCLEDTEVCGGTQKTTCKYYEELLKELPTEEELRVATIKYNGTKEGQELIVATNKRCASRRQMSRQAGN